MVRGNGLPSPLKVHIDYDVEIDGHRYSVPHAFVGQILDARITTRAVELLCRGNRVASHMRSARRGEFTTITAHMPVALAEKVDQLAARLERSRGWIVKQALAAWIDQEEERNRLTREALADVDAGQVIEQQAVQAWADSLSTAQPLSIPR